MLESSHQGCDQEIPHSWCVRAYLCVCVCVFVCGEGEEMWVVGNQSVVNPPPFTARFNAIHVKSSAKASSQGCM